MRIDADLLALLVCPLTRTPLRYDEARGELVSEAAGLAYPVRCGTGRRSSSSRRRGG